MGDVVRAYKGLVKEKEALESSLKVLGANAPPASTGVATESEASESSDKETSNEDGSSCTKEPEPQGKQTTDQLSTLTQSLATLTSEKSRLEQSFQEDKKKLRAEINDKNKTIETLRAELKSAKEKSRTEVEESKSKLIIERHNREK